MNSRTRTFKTLACLATAMTGTSMLLGWMDPTSPHLATRRTLSVILDDARHAVFDYIDLIPGRWDAVDLLAGRVLDGSGTYLAATSQPSPTHHFEIDQEGNVHRTRHWIDQIAEPGAEGAVRVQVQRLSADEPMSRAQWDCVRALVSALRESRAGGSEAFPLHFDDTWVAIYELAPDNAIEIGPVLVNAQ